MVLRIALASILLSAFLANACGATKSIGRATSTPMPSSITSLDESGIRLQLPNPYEIGQPTCWLSGSYRVVSYVITNADHRPLPGGGAEFILAVYDRGFPLDGVVTGNAEATLTSIAYSLQAQGWMIESKTLGQIGGQPGLVLRASASGNTLRQEAFVLLVSGGIVELGGQFEFRTLPRDDQEAAFNQMLNTLDLSGLGLPANLDDSTFLATCS